VLFSISEPTSFEGPFVYLITDKYDTVETKRYYNDKLRYKATSVIKSKNGGVSPLTPSEMEMYLSLPDNLDNRTKPLVNELTAGVDSDEIVAEKIRGYLIENLSYSLNPGDVGDDPLADFLFVNKKGYCEHFATAMVIMLRCAGIRSRLVTGFLAGNYNEYGSFYTVRASDAHAWVEAYFDGVGWVTLDPTPPAGLALPMDISTISRFIENLKMKWNIYIVNFEMKDQMEVLNEVRDVSMKGGDSISDLRKKVSGWVSELKEEGEVIVVPILGIVFAVLLFLIAYIIKSLFFSSSSQRKVGRGGATGVYFKALSLFNKKGVIREESMTPGEFSKNVNEKFPNIKDDFSSLNRAYLSERFGESQPDEKLTKEAFASFTTIKEKLKSHP
jgi:protein-glutamine gamma-glutamyltransferase